MAPALVALALVAVALGGCGEDEEQGGSEPAPPIAGGGGAVSYALAELPRDLDPLSAAGRPAQLVTRQVHEPLVATLSAPYGDDTRQPGLALSVKPSPDRTVWRVVLRTGVRFQDGTPFNAAAVLANSRRWKTRAAGRRLLPDLFAVDAPRPNEVRFQFERPVAALGPLLASPRLGIVSPQAIGPGSDLRPDASGSGTGAFEVTADEPESVQLTRSETWWGTTMGLGPALDAVAFVAASAEADRVALLSTGEARVAEPVGELGARAAEVDPLLRYLPVAGGIGLSASVRGLQAGDGSGVPILSGVWLTTIAG